MSTLSTYCGSFSNRAFKKHIAECGVCWQDAQGRNDLTFDPSTVPNPDHPDTDEHRAGCTHCQYVHDSKLPDLRGRVSLVTPEPTHRELSDLVDGIVQVLSGEPSSQH